jgi:hypothetical protein
VYILGSGGGWATGYYFRGTSGTYRGGFGALGGNDTLSNYWIGPAYDNYYTYIDLSQLTHTSSVRGPIFYDSNDTTYYLDPSSTSYSSYNAGGARFRNIEISNSTYTDTIQNVSSGGNIWINYGHNGPVGLGYGGGLTTAYTSLAVNGTSTTTRLSNTFTISPHSAGVDLHSTVNFAPHYQTDFAWYTGAIGSGTNRATLNSAGDFTANASSRSPIFYDSNNTGYYLDPAGNSSLYYASFANDVQMNGNYLRFDQSGTRSWNIRAASGNLNFNSGDNGGTYVFNGATSFSSNSSCDE